MTIDDFGTGFSSLPYLVKLPVDVLKLDKAFIQELTNQNNISFINSIVTLAHNLNLIVVAEGIESEKQHQVLAQNGCDIGQGYFFNKPLTSEELQRVFFAKKYLSSLLPLSARKPAELLAAWRMLLVADSGQFPTACVCPIQLYRTVLGFSAGDLAKPKQTEASEHLSTRFSHSFSFEKRGFWRLHPKSQYYTRS